MNTLWELAQSWEHDNTGTVFEPLHAPEICRRCQLEQWAREKATEYKLGVCDNGVCASDLEIILADLGVPDEEQNG